MNADVLLGFRHKLFLTTKWFELNLLESYKEMQFLKPRPKLNCEIRHFVNTSKLRIENYLHVTKIGCTEHIFPA